MKPIRYLDFFLIMSKYIKRYGRAPNSNLRWRRAPFTYFEKNSYPAVPKLKAVFLCKLKLGHECINRHSNLLSEWLRVSRSPVYFVRTDTGGITGVSW